MSCAALFAGLLQLLFAASVVQNSQRPSSLALLMALHQGKCRVIKAGIVAVCHLPFFS